MDEPNESAAAPAMTVAEVKALMAESEPGSYLLVDVRQPVEYEEVHIPGAKLVPLPDLIHAVPEWDRSKTTVLYCSTGGRSRVAAQLLKGRGFERVFNMSGGIYSWEGLEAIGPRELNLDLVRGDESPREMLTLAYGMEDGLRRFYDTAGTRSTQAALVDLLSMLSRVEERHKEKLRRMHADLDPGAPELETTGAGVGDRMEGGFRMGEFMEQNEPYLEDPEKVLELAIMLESQALDLYLRFADKVQVEATRELLFAIAQEEIGHLKLLGRLYDEID